MQVLPVVIKRPQPRTGGKWHPVDLQFKSDTEFNEATSLIMKILYNKDATGECTAYDEKGNKWALSLVHSTYDTINNVIRIFPWTAKII